MREFLLPDFAETFTLAGFSSITFDYRCFGDSDGEPGRIVSAMQIDDIISVVNRAREQPSLDAQRISLWGTSFEGCYLFGAALRSQGVKCIVSQLAFADGEGIVSRNMNNEEKEFFLSTRYKMTEKQKSTGKEIDLDPPSPDSFCILS